MKKYLTTILLLFFVITVKSQSYIGFLTDNYSGVHSVISNPANIADSRFKTDINLIGASSLLGNDYISISSKELLSGDGDFDNDNRRTPKDDNNFFLNTEILGPSFMFNINDKSSVAVFTRGRILVGITDINGLLYESVSDDFEGEDYTISEGNFNVSGNSWLEVGISYAREIYNKEQHYVKGGLSLKYLRGIANSYASGDNVSVDFDADGTSPTDGSITTTGEIYYGNTNTDDIDEFESSRGSKGMGLDFGLVYEWRPDYKEYASGNVKDKNKYKLKLGVSITDIGSIKYKNAEQIGYNLNTTISESDYNSTDNDLDNVLPAFYTEISRDDFTKAVLPTALHLNADYNLKGSWYVNLNTDLSLISKTKINASRTTNLATLTPRFERKWFSFYTPISYMQHSGFQAGFGLRAGPLYLGSGSIVSLLISDKSQAADAYAGLKIPIYQSRPKDKDGDGVIDKLDDCRTVAGPVENNGCPWIDTDGDSVLDKDDKCPEIAGEVDNDGCVWKDTDGDTVLDKDDKCSKIAGEITNNGCVWKDTDGDTVLDKDDECPELAGAISNKGCPIKVKEVDTDGDTIVDSKDNCPTVIGTIANNGCPEISDTVQKELNNYAKTILFNSGKATIKTESFIVLTDIINILNKYPSAKFRIEGHTDSVGSDLLNEKLSNNRANTVMSYLIENGVESKRLRAVGYGELYPIATNTTSQGRKDNRRVEINLIKE